MPSAAELTAVLKGRDDGAGKVLDSLKDKAGGFGSALGTVGKIAGGIVLGQGLLKAPGFLVDAAQAAADDAASVSRLQRAVENANGSYDKYSGKIADVIKRGQDLAFTDDQTRSGLAILTAQTSDTDEAMRRLSLAEDLARGTGLDLETASRLLGKVTDENVNVLKRYGISVTASGNSNKEATKALDDQIAKLQSQAAQYDLNVRAQALHGTLTDAQKKKIDATKLSYDQQIQSLKNQKVALDASTSSTAGAITEEDLFAAVNAKFNGQAQAFADTTAGKMARFKDQMSELKESIGYAVLPAMTALADFAIAKLVPTIESLINRGIALGRQIFPDIRDAVREVLPILEGIGRAVLDTVVPAFLSIVEAGAGIARDVIPAIKDLYAGFSAGFTGTGTSDLTGLAGAAADVAGALMNAYVAGTIFGGWVLTLVGTIGTILGPLFNVVFTAQNVSAAWDGIKTAAQAAWSILEPMINFIGEHNEIVLAFAAAAGLVAVAFGAYSLAMAAASAATAAFGIVLAIATSPITLIIVALGLLILAGYELIKHWDEVKAKAEEVWNGLPGPVRAALNAVRSVVESVIGDVKMIFEGMYRTLSGIVSLVVDLIHGDWSKAWQDLKQIASGIVESLMGFLRLSFGGMGGIILDAAGSAASAALEFGIGIANGIASGVKSGINWIIDAVNKVLGFIRGVHISIPSVDLGPLGKIGGGTLEIPGVPGDIGRLAAGTSFWRGGLTWVGENGPELAYLPRGTAVAPSGRGFGGDVHVHLEGANIYGIADLDAQIRKAVRDGANAGAFRGILA